MRAARRQGRCRRIGLGLGALVLVATSAAADLPEPTVERIEAELLSMQKLIRNAQMRVESPIMELERREPGSTPKTAPLTPGDECCLSHQEKLLNHMLALRSIVDQLEPRFAQEKNEQAVFSLQEARSWLRTLAQGLLAFKEAPSTERATQALQGFIRPFNNLRTSLRAVESCCLPAAQPTAADSKAKPAPAPGR